jgi:hypothetical protein
MCSSYYQTVTYSFTQSQFPTANCTWTVTIDWGESARSGRETYTLAEGTNLGGSQVSHAYGSFSQYPITVTRSSPCSDGGALNTNTVYFTLVQR